MKINHRFAMILLGCLLVSPLVMAKKTENLNEVLVTIDGSKITRGDLKTALASSPFYTQFNTLNEKSQALMRGDLLKRLVTSRLLKEEARRQNLDKTDAFKQDLIDYKEGLNYRRFINNLRKNIKINEDDLKTLQAKYKGNPDAFAAAKSKIITSKFKSLLKLTLMKLRDSYHVKLYEDRLNKNPTADTLLMTGDDGLKLSYGELISSKNFGDKPDKNALQQQLYQQVEFILLGKSAKDEAYNFDKELTAYAEERLAAVLIENKKKQWIPDEKAIKSYYQKHPTVGVVSDRWHIGQLVVATKEQAEWALQEIKSGKKSLFQLAGALSIDPYGKSHNGDMGWIKQGDGMPAIEQALKKLKDNEISDIIKTPKGFHLVTILKRRGGETIPYQVIKDKLHQMLLSEKLGDYLKTLQKKHTIKWKVMAKDEEMAKQLLQSKGG